MQREPSSPFLGRAGVVQNHVQFAIWWSVRHDLIHELQEVFSALERGLAGLDFTGGHLQGGEHIQGTMTFVGALETPHDLAVGGFNIAGGSRQCLNV